MNARTGKKLRVTKIEKKTCPAAVGLNQQGIVNRTVQDTHERNRVRIEQHPYEVDNWKQVAFLEASRMSCLIKVRHRRLRSVPCKHLPNSCGTVIKVGRECILRGLWLRALKPHDEDEGCLCGKELCQMLRGRGRVLHPCSVKQVAPTKPAPAVRASR